MNVQEVVTILSKVSFEDVTKEKNHLKLYPELNEYFEKEMYIESFSQMYITSGKILPTFIFRSYNSSSSKNR